jgi:chondroitin 4-sulfotransferase 11
MLISTEKKFLFIHIQKTAGSSLARLLKSQAPDTRPFLGQHDHALWAKKHLASQWNEYYKFAFVRNPWDRLVSWYEMIRQDGKLLPWYKRLPYEMIRQNGKLFPWCQRFLQRKHYKPLWQYILRNASDFDEFLFNCTDIIEDVDGKRSCIYNQLDYLTDDNGDIIVDFVGKYENLQHDVSTVFKALRLESLPLPHVNKSQHKHYSEYYTEETKNLTAERYSRDIQFFGYRFEGSPHEAPNKVMQRPLKVAAQSGALNR